MPKRKAKTKVPQIRLATKHQTTHMEGFCLPIELIPECARDNRYILSGYRRNLGWRRTSQSLCILHNETLNIWTHLIGVLIALTTLILTLCFLSPHGIDYLPTLWNELSTQPQPQHAEAVLSPAFSQYEHHFDAECPVHMTSFDKTFDHFIHLHHGMCPVEPETLLLGFFSSRSMYLRELLHKLSAETGTLVSTIGETLPRNLFRYVDLENEHTATATDAVHHYASVLGDTLLKLKQAAIHTSHLAEDAARTKLDEIRDALLVSHIETGMRSAEIAGLAHYLGVKKNDLLAATQEIFDSFFSVILNSLPKNQTSSSLTSPLDAIYPLSLSNLFSPTFHIPDGAGVVSFLPVWPIAVYIFSAMTCFLCSTLFHLFQAVSERKAVTFQCFDYAGITILIGGSNVPVLYYGFFCSPTLRNFYLIQLGLVSLLGFYVAATPRYLRPVYRVVRACVFALMGCSGVIPVLHFLFTLGDTPPFIWYLVAMGVLYLTGAAIYVTQIPERCMPGKFDLLGASHQWWHLLIIAAVFVEYYGVLDAFRWRMTHHCPLE